MGNYDTRPIRFFQSSAAFPCTVELGRTSPSFGITRNKSGIRFTPPDDEGFTLRGDRQMLLYKGRRRSHRFSILGNTAFEYDCILEREPDSNVISLFIEGAEDFDFFRQPDFVEDPFLKGSYAVYKKETLVGEGTGKLCHIHRPEIIDARGRRCWGDLTVVGSRLYITIPETWLGEAKYPVIVDPTIGTTTIGSQYRIVYDPPDDPWIQLTLEGNLPVNRFLVSETINGLCTAYFYTNDDNYDDNGCRPILYSDNASTPLTRKSTEEQFIDLSVRSGKPKGWRSGTCRSSGSITSGSYIWFGAFADFFWEPRFDYGTRCYFNDWYDIGNSIPNTYPLGNGRWYDDYQLSMYFTYTSGQQYTRKLTQGVTLTDNRKTAIEYERTVSQIVNVTSIIERIKIPFHNISEIVSPTLFVNSLGAYQREIKDSAGSETETSLLKIIFHKIEEKVYATGALFRGLIFYVKIFTQVHIRDFILGRFLKAREELILKSSVSREITLDSRIH